MLLLGNIAYGEEKMLLKGKRIAILAENEYEDLELWVPYYRMLEEGAEVQIIGTPASIIFHSKHGYPVKVDEEISTISVNDFDAVIIPGGYAPDKLRRYPDVVNFVNQMSSKGKLVAMICHAGWVPISAGIVKDKLVTSTIAIKDDLINAGAKWVNEEVVIDENLISSRSPSDLPAFSRAIINALS